MSHPALTIHTSSEEETIEAGRTLAARLRGVVLLSGGLGAGKTTLVRGIVSAIDGASANEVSSPTFTLIHDYGAGVFHIDLYRLDTRAQMETLGLDDIFEDARLVLIEWGEKLSERMPRARTEIRIDQPSENERIIRILEIENGERE